jgi:hypothetical protein
MRAVGKLSSNSLARQGLLALFTFEKKKEKKKDIMRLKIDVYMGGYLVGAINRAGTGRLSWVFLGLIL